MSSSDSSTCFRLAATPLVVGAVDMVIGGGGGGGGGAAACGGAAAAPVGFRAEATRLTV